MFRLAQILLAVGALALPCRAQNSPEDLFTQADSGFRLAQRTLPQAVTTSTADVITSLTTSTC